MSQTTCIRNADWVVSWNAEKQRHQYLRGADVAFTGNTIEFVGPRYTGPVNDEIDGNDLMVMPGLVNIHCHPTNQPITRGVREELGNPSLYMSALYDRTGLWRNDDEGLLTGVEVAFGELLKSGVTTAIDYASRAPDGWIDVLARSGMRIFAAPSFRDASWHVANGSRLEFEWDERAGKQAFDKAMGLIEEADNHPSGRLSGVVAPAQVDTCTVETFEKSMQVAKDKNVMWQTHVSQSVVEFHEMTRRTGKTPIQWLNDIGMLGPHSTLGHSIFIDEHSWIHWHTRDDLRLIAETGTTVAHCPLVFSRYGQKMESLGRYMRAGVNVGIGTDTAPHNMLEEMRQGLVVSRLASGDIYDLTTGDVFHAATVGGARAYRRDDIGRLAPGAKADVVLVDLTNSLMRPLRDPLRNLIYTAADRAVRDVYVDGAKVVENGEVLTMDIPAALARLDASQQRAEAEVPQHEPDGRSGQEVSPLVLEMG